MDPKVPLTMDQLNQVIVLYDLDFAINNEQVNIRKDELLTLLSKSNEDWWLVKRGRTRRSNKDLEDRNGSDASSHDEDEDEGDIDDDGDEEEDRTNDNPSQKTSSKTFFVPSSYIRELNYVQFFPNSDNHKSNKKLASSQSSTSSSARRKQLEMDDDEKRSDEAIGSSRDSLDVISEDFDDCDEDVEDRLHRRCSNGHHCHFSSNKVCDNANVNERSIQSNRISKIAVNNCDHDPHCDKLEGIYAEPTLILKARPRRIRRAAPPPLYANITPPEVNDSPDNAESNCCLEENNCSSSSSTSSISAESSTNSSLTASPLSSIVDSNFKLKRTMFDGWAEYIDENGRRLYYNSESQRKAWKPPRRLTTTNGASELNQQSTHPAQSNTLSFGTTIGTSSVNLDHPNTSHQSQQPSNNNESDNEILISESVRKIVEKLDSNLKIKRSPSSATGNRTNTYHHHHNNVSQPQFSRSQQAQQGAAPSSSVNLPLTSQLKNRQLPGGLHCPNPSSSDHHQSGSPPSDDNPHLQSHSPPHHQIRAHPPLHQTQSDATGSTSSSQAPLARVNKLLSNFPPNGWSRYFNLQTKEVYFVNNHNDSKWFCKEDENGQIYFYEENGQGVCSELPTHSSTTANNCADGDGGVTGDEQQPANNENVDHRIAKLRNTAGAATSVNQTFAAAAANLAEFSQRLITANCPNEIKSIRPMSTNLERSIKSQSMAMLAPRTIVADNYEIVFKEEFKHSSPFNNAIMYPSPPTLLDLKDIIYNGTLNRTRTVIAGKVYKRKHWSTSFVVLTQFYLLFFKDQKTAFQAGSKPEFVLGLLNASIDWSPNKSSRKNCFQVSTFQDQVLLQDENSDRSAKWFSTISQTITKLPPPFNSTSSAPATANFVNCNVDAKGGGIKLKRSRSTKQYRPNEEYNNIQGSNTLSGYATISNTPMIDKKIKIRERLRLFLRKRPTLESLREKGIFKDENIFGCNLELLCLRDKALIPKFVQQCVQAIESKDLKSDGIYRACGNLSSVQKLRFEINQDNYHGLWKEEDVHVLTGLLKMFFRDMKEPLFPCDRFEMLMNSIAIKNKETKLESFRKLINELPTNNYHTMNFMFQHLLRVISYSQENRMHIQNLAIVFGPTLMRAMNDLNNLALDMMLQMQQSQVVEFLLQEYSSIFLQPTELQESESEPFD